MQIYGSKELVANVHQGDLCIGCGGCVNLCPYLRAHRGRVRMLFPCTLEQGRCFAHCPKAEVDLEALSRKWWGTPYTGSPMGNYRTIHASRAGKKALKGLFQGGGTTSALMHFALSSGNISGAVLTRQAGLNPDSCIATSPEEIVGCAGSKYGAAPTLATLNLAHQKGMNHLGIVGTPCQMTAVAQMRANPLERDDFLDPVALTVGLFCNWSLDSRLLSAFLSERMDIASIRSMDIPPPPADTLIVETDNGKTDIPLSEIKPLIPPTCFICMDMTAEWSDVSVGMLEGRSGWNTLIIRTEKGDDMVERAVEGGFIEMEAYPKENRAALTRAAAGKKARALRMLIRRRLINTAESQGCSAVRVPKETMDQILNSNGRMEA